MMSIAGRPLLRLTMTPLLALLLLLPWLVISTPVAHADQPPGTWGQETYPAGPNIKQLASDPNDATRLWATMELSTDNDLMYRTDDAGDHWSLLGSGLVRGCQNYNVLSIHPDGLHMATPCRNENGRGLYLSDDGGATWRLSTFAGQEVRLAVIAKADPRVIYANSNPDGLATNVAFWRSADGGQTWTAADHGLPSAPYWLDTHPGDASRAYAVAFPWGTSDTRVLWQTSDGGANWQAMGVAGLPLPLQPEDERYPCVERLVVDPNQPSTMLAVVIEAGKQCLLGQGYAYNGLYRSTDGGQNWQATGITGFTARALAADPVNHGTYYLIIPGPTYSDPSRLYRSTDSGATWQPVGDLPSGAEQVVVDWKVPQTLYTNGSISHDSGQTWTAVRPAPARNQAILWGHPAGGLLGASDGLYRSIDGSEWQTIDGSLPGSRPITALAVAPTTPPTVYAGVPQGADMYQPIFRSRDGGTHWTPLANGLSIDENYGQEVQWLYAQTGQPESVYAAVVAPLTTGQSPTEVYHSLDGGDTWHRIWTSSPSPYYTKVRGIAHDGTAVYIASDLGLHRSSDDGANWEDITPVLSGATRQYTYVSNLLITDNTIFAVAYGSNSQGYFADGGIFRRAVGESAWQQDTVNVSDNIPRPLSFNGLMATAEGIYVQWQQAALNFSNTGTLRWDGAAWQQISQPLCGQLLAVPAAGRRLLQLLGAGLIRSDDAGATWQARNDGLGPQRFGTQIVGQDDTVIMTGGPASIFKSTDRGATWKLVVFEPSNVNWGLICELGAQTLAMHPADSNLIYSGIGNYLMPGGRLYRSTDGGDTWQRTSYTESAMAVRLFAGDKQKVWVAARGLGITYSPDQGNTFQTQAAEWYPIYDLSVDPYNANVILASTDRSECLIRSSDGGQTWTSALWWDPGRPACGWPNDSIKVTFNPYTPGLAYAGGGYVSTDGGLSWRLTTGVKWPEAFDSAIRSSNRRLVYSFASRLRSTDGASTWRSLPQPLPYPQTLNGGFGVGWAADSPRLYARHCDAASCRFWSMLDSQIYGQYLPLTRK